MKLKGHLRRVRSPRRTHRGLRSRYRRQRAGGAKPSLLFFELASHSDEGLSLVGKHPHIVAHWEISGDEPDALFTFRWEEFNTSAATRREDSDFASSCLTA